MVSARAKSCILVYLWGGPPQQDTWDLKPDAPDGIRSPFLPINTVVPGIQICDQLPQIAKHTDKMAIIRSFTHPSNQHEVGVYHTLTGKINNTLVVPRNQRNRRDFPTIGSIVSYFSPPGDLPASVTIPRPIGHDGVVYTGTYAGFLGPQHDPLELQAPAEVNEKAAARPRTARRLGRSSPAIARRPAQDRRAVRPPQPAARPQACRPVAISRAGVPHAHRSAAQAMRSISRKKPTSCATATAATNTASRSCSPAGWSKRACGW